MVGIYPKVGDMTPGHHTCPLYLKAVCSGEVCFNVFRQATTECLVSCCSVEKLAVPKPQINICPEDSNESLVIVHWKPCRWKMVLYIPFKNNYPICIYLKKKKTNNLRYDIERCQLVNKVIR